MSFTNDAPLVIALASMAYTNTAPLVTPLQSSIHAASGTLTLTANPTDGEAVTIGGKSYGFVDTLTSADGVVKIGANAAATIANLVAAINLAAGSGTTYGSGTTPNVYVVASINAGNTSAMDVVAKVNGVAGFYSTTESLANGSWGAAALAFPAPSVITVS